MFSDSHVHLDQYDLSEIDDVIERASDAGVSFMISAGTTVKSSKKCIELANKYPQIFAGVGIHPMDINNEFTKETYRELQELVSNNEKVVAISEIGLDFLEGMPSKELQYHAFREQIRLARELGIAIIFHAREAEDETLRVLQEEKAYEVGVIAHYFQGDEITAKKCLELDFFISIARPLLRLPHLQELISKFPLNRIVLETDSFPQPFKKKRYLWTEPRHIIEIASKLADLTGLSLEKIEEITTQNLIKALGNRAKVIGKYVGPTT